MTDQQHIDALSEPAKDALRRLRNGDSRFGAYLENDMSEDSVTALQAAIDAWQSIADDWIAAEPLDGDEGTREQLQLVLDAARERARMIVVETMR